MTVFDIVKRFTSGSRLIINLFNADDVLFDNNIDCIFIERPDLLSYRVKHIDAYDINDCGVNYHIDDGGIYSNLCTNCIELTVYKPTLLSKTLVKLKYHIPNNKSFLTIIHSLLSNMLIDLKISSIRMLFNKWFILNDGFEMNQLFDSSSLIPINNHGIKLCIYTKNIRKRSSIKYKFPIFRIWVLNFDVNPTAKYLGFIERDSDYWDYTMVFTLERNPRWLQDYETVKKQLGGNIISKKEIEAIVNYVSEHYQVFQSAWDIDTDMFGTYSCGFDVNKLKSID